MSDEPVSLDIRSCRAKVAWAQEHIDSLDRQIRGWFNQRGFREVRRQSGDGLRHSVVANITRPPDLERWSLIAGDAFHNLRAALDHLVFAITASELSPSEMPDPRIVAMPITDSPQAFKSKYFRIEKLSEHTRQAIERLQPFNRPHDVLPPLLGLLRDFNDVDKHRMLQLVIAQPKDAEVSSFNFPFGPGESVDVQYNWDAIRDGSELMVITLPRPMKDLSFKFKGSFGVAMAHSAGPQGHTSSSTEILMKSFVAEVNYVIDHLSGISRKRGL